MNDERKFNHLLESSGFITDIGKINLNNFEKVILVASAIYNTPNYLKLLKYQIDNKRNLQKQTHIQNMEAAKIERTLKQSLLDSQRAIEVISYCYRIYNKRTVYSLDYINAFLEKKPIKIMKLNCGLMRIIYLMKEAK